MATEAILFEGGPRDGETTSIVKVEREAGQPTVAERTDKHFTDEQHIGIAIYIRTTESVEIPVARKVRGGIRTKDVWHTIYRYHGTIIRDRETMIVLGEEK